MRAGHLFPRYATARLTRMLARYPVVLVHGPRQCGKTTLARIVAEAEGYDYIDFDEREVCDFAKAEPDRFIKSLPERIVMDEVQRVPEMFGPLKVEVDRNRIPGRFILTGSSNILLMPHLSESLTGRMGIIRLHPLAQGELVQGAGPLQSANFLDRLFAGDFQGSTHSEASASLAQRVATGGYPASIACATDAERMDWYRTYIDTLIQRNVRDLARIRSLETFSQLVRLACACTGQLHNANNLATLLSVAQPTVQHHTLLLKQMFLLETLEAWSCNDIKKMVKKPKMHVGDTGIACALLNKNAATLEVKDRELFGHLVETFVFQELRRCADGFGTMDRFYHFRAPASEVDIVVERNGLFAGIEVKAGSNLSRRDFGGLKKMRESLKENFAVGVVLYDGRYARKHDEDVYALPIQELWAASPFPPAGQELMP